MSIDKPVQNTHAVTPEAAQNHAWARLVDRSVADYTDQIHAQYGPKVTNIQIVEPIDATTYKAPTNNPCQGLGVWTVSVDGTNYVVPEVHCNVNGHDGTFICLPDGTLFKVDRRKSAEQALQCDATVSLISEPNSQGDRYPFISGDNMPTTVTLANHNGSGVVREDIPGLGGISGIGDHLVKFEYGFVHSVSPTEMISKTALGLTQSVQLANQQV